MYTDFQWPRQSLVRNVLTRIYEPIQPFLMVELARAFRADMFLDVGANIGVYSLMMSTVPGIDPIMAFEPAPESNRLLRQAIERNGLEGRVSVFDVALSDTAGEAEFGIVSETSGANGLVSGAARARDAFAEIRTVERVPLDALVGEQGRRIAIKIDVEGHERAVLAGAGRLLAQNAVLLQIEGYGEGGAATLDELAGHGFVRLSHVGPDSYLTNAPDAFDEAGLLRAFEAAASRSVESNLSLAAEKPKVARVRAEFGVVAIELNGRLADLARRARRRLAPRRS